MLWFIELSHPIYRRIRIGVTNLALVLKLKEEDEQVAFSKEDIPNRNRELVG